MLTTRATQMVPLFFLFSITNEPNAVISLKLSSNRVDK